MALKGRFTFRRFSILWSWFLSYSVILLIPILIGLFVYLQVRQLVETEINRANAALLEQVKQVLDGQIDNVNRMSVQEAFLPQVRGLLYAEQPLTEQTRYSITLALKEFKSLMVAHEMVTDSYVYYRKGNFLLSQSAVYDPDDYFQTHHATGSNTKKEWDALLNRKYVGDLVVYPYTNDVGVTKQAILYMRSLPAEDRGEPLGTSVVVLEMERFQAPIQKMNWINQGSVFILTEDNVVLASTKAMRLPASISYDRLTEQSGMVNETWDGEKMAVSYITSDSAKLKYISVLPVQVFQEKSSYIRNLTILGLLATLLLGAAAAYLLARRSYHPVNKLVRSLSNQAQFSLAEAGNEYSLIFHALDQQNKMLRNYLFERLMKGRLEPNFPLREALETHEITFAGERFAVMLILIEDYSEMFRQPHEDAEHQHRFVQMIVGNIVEEMCRQRHVAYMTDLDDMLACLINVQSGSDEEVQEELYRIVGEARQLIERKFNILFTTSISRIHLTTGGIPAAYQEALKAMEYKMLMGSTEIIQYEQLQSQEPEYWFTWEKEQRLITAIKVGETSLALALLDEVFEAMHVHKRLPIEMVRCFLFDMAGTVMKALYEADYNRSSMSDQQQALWRLLESENVNDIQRGLSEILKQITGDLSQKKNRPSGLVDDLTAYMQAHYQEANLGVAAIAEHFGMNPVYLTRVYKEHTRDTLLDALNKTRIQAAKELLVDDKLTIKEIAEQVGFYSSNTFIRTFKKVESITPGMYRDMLKGIAKH
ncbi:helix-turn-helix domain-containing protein [Bacillus sp. 3255]|uniref:AraC family transcriptional regulator n=1 Tax=Bacillus sp. 3255 TaxID=2817904 RepID=UPI0028612B3B|nr:helix-turn-helix domain-containing protein [Bacillus sp. 3255]MDR6880815.1 YesN/AraC family two-component response regulator [Bacillus sp. 3255]